MAPVVPDPKNLRAFKTAEAFAGWKVERLIAEQRMTPQGLRHVEAAKADGRWDAA